MLTVTDLHTYYGRAHILQGLSFSLEPGQVTVLLGRNGAGKSTTLKSLMHLVRPARGRIRFGGTDITGWPPDRIARAGIGYVPEDRRIFTTLTVAENLDVGRQPARPGQPAWTEDRLFALFPNLAAMRQRPGGQMSGGEQQMLAIARTLMGSPTLLLLDEPNEGLAPIIVEQLGGAIRALKQTGLTVLLAEQNLAFAAATADRALVIESGRIVWSGTMRAFLDDAAARTTYLAI
ncbi:ABC transporter ATP-binding protein [Rhodopila sp.]|uniref:ABC transporter ATP-binding protein n=1 Tax=Rhodopila sp. TaxID=2480087 RepID=UPI002B800D68|nr:ABC transporter ATP-binding protein [Rhodopila sp.]HVZ09887.1 ABC transporter ATP-binding protein [Rhodopila sp.]